MRVLLITLFSLAVEMATGHFFMYYNEVFDTSYPDTFFEQV